MKFRRFNEAGIAAFGGFLSTLRVSPAAPVPVDLLTNEQLTEPLANEIEARSPAVFASRMEFARWLHDGAATSQADIPRDDVGFWAWLSLALFDQVCPADGAGKRKPGADPRHIMNTANWKRRYRHLLQNPYEIFYLHRDDPARALVALVNPLHKPGELTENINGRQEIVNCLGCMALFTFLCVDSQGQRRKGASGEFANNFGKSVNRISRTFDLPAMQPVESAKLFLHQRKLKKLVEVALAGEASG